MEIKTTIQNENKQIRQMDRLDRLDSQIKF